MRALHRALCALQLPDDVRALLHVAGLALVTLGGSVLVLTSATAGAYVALAGIGLLALQPQHPNETRSAERR